MYRLDHLLNGERLQFNNLPIPIDIIMVRIPSRVGYVYNNNVQNIIYNNIEMRNLNLTVNMLKHVGRLYIICSFLYSYKVFIIMMCSACFSRDGKI